MMPGMNPRQMQAMMRQMGMQQVEVDAQQVIIRTKDKDIIIDAPQVSKVTMMGQQTYQVAGTAREEKRTLTYVPNEDDAALVSEQTGKTLDEAREALTEAAGDIAQAIVRLS